MKPTKLGEATIDIKTTGMEKLKKDLDIVIKKMERIQELKNDIFK